MTIFGGDTNVTAHNTTTLADTTLNYTYSLLLLLAIVTSLLLNPVVFYYNYLNNRQKRSLVSGLLMLLALLDFIYIYRSTVTAYNLLKPKHDHLLMHTSVPKKIQGFLDKSVYYYSMVVTLWMCFVRYIKIRAPMWAQNHRHTIHWSTAVVLITSFVIIVPCQGLILIDRLNESAQYSWFSPFQHFIAKNKLNIWLYCLTVAPFYVMIALSVIFSVLTAVHLGSERGQQLSEVKRRSMFTILWLNGGNLVWMALAIVINLITEFSMFKIDRNKIGHFDYPYYYYYLMFLDWVMMPCLLSAYSPLIICIRSSGIRGMLCQCVSRMPGKYRPRRSSASSWKTKLTTAEGGNVD